MIVSEARREANRRNAQLSTGPRTEAGKDRSRRNALTHGLSAEVVRLPEDDAAIGAAAAAVAGPVAPALDWPGWLADEVAVIATRLRRCERLDRGCRDRVVLRAELSWDDDRRLEVEALAAGLKEDPAGVARALGMTPWGCDWMIERWSLLARAADRERTWTAEQKALAFDLLGRPAELRGGTHGEAIDPEGRAIPASLGVDPAALARQEVAALLRRKAERSALDAFDRSLARDDAAPDDADADLRKLRRHEAALHRRLRWCVARIEKSEAPPEAPPTPPLAPEPPARPVPLDPTPVQPFDPADLFKALDSETPARAPSTRRPDPRTLKEKARRAARLAHRQTAPGRETNPSGAEITPSIRPANGDKLGPR